MVDKKEDTQEEVEPQKTMLECQIINYILDQASMSIVKKGSIDESYFPGYKDEFLFIKRHYEKYQVVPDLSTFLNKFSDFDLFEVDEAEDALIDSIKEEKGYSLVTKALQDINEKTRDNSIEAARLMKDKADIILKEISIVKYREGYDLFKMGFERAEEYLKRIETKGLLGCMTNIEKLDNITNGWRDTDFVSITARPQEGKSWIFEYFLLMPWLLQKKKVLMFSLENNKELVGYRADTLLRNFSNEALMGGKSILSWDSKKRPGKRTKDYMQYIEEIKHFDVPFIVLDGLDSPMDKPFNMEIIEEIIDVHQPDIIGIDQLSLLSPHSNFKSIREGYVQITRYIRNMVNRRGKPMILVSQSGREASKMRDKQATPELHQIAESDSVGQDSTRVISLRVLDGILKLSLKKNTFGRSGVDVLAKWDIDYGLIQPLALEEGDPDQEQNF